MTDSGNTPEARVAFALADASRSLGMETGLTLAMRLVHARWSLLAETGDGGRTAWNELLEQTPADLQFGDWALRHLRGPREAAKLSWYRLDSHASHVAMAMAVRLEELPGAGPRIRESHRLVFERLLELHAEALGRTSGEHRTRPEVARAVVGLATAPLGVVVDPACGFAETLLHAHAVDPDALLVGWDVNVEALQIARMRLALAGVEARLGEHDVLVDPPTEEFDTVFLQPPWGMQDRSDSVMRSFPFADPARNLDLAWAQRAYGLLGPGGSAVVHLPEGSLWRAGADARVRAAMLEVGAVEAVIALPEGMAFGTRVKSAFVVLRRVGSGQGGQEVLLVDGSDAGVLAEGNQIQLSDRDIDELLTPVAEWRRRSVAERAAFAVPELARSVMASDIAAHDNARLVPGDYVEKAARQPAPIPQPSGRLLKELRLENLKSFGASQRIRLAPITLLYGPNAAGKSTILQSLMLLRQSLAAGALITQGEVDLGSFEGAIHRHDLARELGLGVTFAAPLRFADPDGMADPSLDRSLDLRFSSTGGGRPVQSGATVGFGGYATAFDRPGSLSAQAQGDVFHSAASDVAGWIAELADGLIYRAPDPAAREMTAEARDRDAARRARRASDATRLIRRHLEEGVSFQADGLVPADALVEPGEYFSGVGQGQARISVIRKQFAELSLAFSSLAVELRGLLDDAAWLGPLRSAPQRFYSRTTTPGLARSGRGGESIAMYLYDNASEVAIVNEWFAELDIPYELRIAPVYAGDQTPTVGDLVAIVLHDKRLGVDASPADVGFGVSQVLPIVVELVARQESLVVVEQPEIHLHPRLQAQLADLLIASTNATGQANQVLVETHSEHLLLRLQRRIREGVLDARDVSVVYVDLREGDNQATATELRLDSDGYFLDDWPQGFFDERLDELFGSEAQ